jgi:hypothetical protein
MSPTATGCPSFTVISEPDLEGDGHYMVGTVNLDFLARFVNQLDLRAHSLGRLGAALWVDNDEVDRPVTSSICSATVARFSTFSNFTVPAYSVTIGRVCGSHVASCAPALTACRRQPQGCAVWNLVALALATIVVGNHHLAGAGDDDLLVLRIGDVAHGCGKPDHARTLGLDTALRRGTRRGAADVEGAHGQLRARFANRLGSDDADRLAGIDQRTASQVTAIALGAQDHNGFRRTTGCARDFVDAQLFDQIDLASSSSKVPAGKMTSWVSG